MTDREQAWIVVAFFVLALITWGVSNEDRRFILLNFVLPFIGFFVGVAGAALLAISVIGALFTGTWWWN